MGNNITQKQGVKVKVINHIHPGGAPPNADHLGSKKNSYRSQTGICRHPDHEGIEELPRDKFSEDSSNNKNHGLYQYCKVCESLDNFKRTHGLPKPVFDKIAQLQGYVCHSCGNPPKGKHLKVDKAAATKNTLFCEGCVEMVKSMRGMKRAVLAKLLKYLRSHP